MWNTSQVLCLPISLTGNKQEQGGLSSCIDKTILSWGLVIDSLLNARAPLERRAPIWPFFALAMPDPRKLTSIACLRKRLPVDPSGRRLALWRAPADQHFPHVLNPGPSLATQNTLRTTWGCRALPLPVVGSKNASCIPGSNS